jgi:hypothetical protein
VKMTEELEAKEKIKRQVKNEQRTEKLLVF